MNRRNFCARSSTASFPWPRGHTTYGAHHAIRNLGQRWETHGKTGTATPDLANGKDDEEHQYGWYVGWAKKGRRTIVFARLVRDGQAYFFNYGLASKESNTPEGTATLFELGSVSKTLTATLGSYAQVMGKLSLADHPGKYMPGLKGSAIDKASLLNLSTYTAGGLPLQFPDAVTDAAKPDYFVQWKPDALPGVQRRYSNPSLGLFGYLTSLALKADFADAMEQQLFPQLGLSNTYIRLPESEMANYAWVTTRRTRRSA